jgi:hypothetical protein
MYSIFMLSLDNMNIEYIIEKKFDEYKYKNPLPFDVYIPLYDWLIEGDDSQHFEIGFYCKTKDKLDEIKERDKIKTDFAIKNNKHFTRIAYSELNNVNKHMKKIFFPYKRKNTNC